MTRYPGIYRGSVFLWFSLLLGASGTSFGQCSHLDSALAIRLGTALSQEAGGKPFMLAADSGLGPFIAVVPHGNAGTLLQISNFSAKIGTEDSKHLGDSKIARVSVECYGTSVEQGSAVARRWALLQVFPLPVTPADIAVLETNRDRYVTIERPAAESWWASTVEPALVVLGAAVIIALFFLIRS